MVTKLHVFETFDQTTFHKSLVILAFIGAELAGGGGADSAPPSMARYSGLHSRARDKNDNLVYFCLTVNKDLF